MQQPNAFSVRARSGEKHTYGRTLQLTVVVVGAVGEGGVCIDKHGTSHVTSLACPDQTLYCDLLSEVKCMIVEVVDAGIGLQAVGNHTKVPADRIQLSKAGGTREGKGSRRKGMLTSVHYGQLELWTVQGTPL